MNADLVVYQFGGREWVEAQIADDSLLLDLPKLEHDLPALSTLLAECDSWQAAPSLAGALVLISRLQAHLLPYTVPGFSRRRRRALLERDGWRCYLCGRTLSKRIGTIDHVQPLSRGGVDVGVNMRAACETCNNLKGALTVDEFREQHQARLMICGDLLDGQ